MGSKGNFKVTITAKHVVAAAVPLQDHSKLPLSNLDLLLPPLDVNIFFCYKNNNIDVNYDNKDRNNEQQEYSTFKSKVSILKKALAQALAYFYPFAGEIVINSAGEPEILCNNRGVDFTEASADVELCALNLHKPDESIEGKLVPRKKDAIFSVQVTELRCGGIVVACAFDHRVADAYSANMFWVTWAEMATFKPISSTPNLCRSILNSRDPLIYYDSYDEMYLPLSSLPTPKPDELQKFDPLITRVYFISKDHLDSLQSLCTDNEAYEKKYSRLQSFSAFLWQIIASHACQLGVDYVHKISMMGIVVDGRTRLCSGESKEKEQALASYFGNVLAIAFGENTCGGLKEMPVSKLAKLVHGFLEKPMTKDHFLGLVDWVEAHRPESAVTKIYCTKENDGPAFVVSSGLRFPVSKIDFGWGNASFGSYHFPWGGNCGYVMPMPTPSENGDWIVYMHLREEQLDYVEAVAFDMFKPISLDMINDS